MAKDAMEGKKKLSDEEKDRLYYERGWEYVSAGTEEEQYRTMERRAKNGDPVFMIQLSEYFENNLSHRDMDKAKYWAQEAARAGDEDAYARLAVLSVKTGDAEGAMEWLNKGAEADSVECLYDLGRLYQGRTPENRDLEKLCQVPADLEKAVRYLKAAYEKAKAAESGSGYDRLKFFSAYDEAEKELNGKKEKEKKTPVYREPVWFEVIGILASVLVAALSVLFVKTGASRGNEAEIVIKGFLLPVLVDILCIGGIVVLSGVALGSLTFSVFETFGLGAFFGGVGGLVAVICLGVYPVTQKIVFCAAGAVAAILLFVMIPIRRKIFR